MDSALVQLKCDCFDMIGYRNTSRELNSLYDTVDTPHTATLLFIPQRHGHSPRLSATVISA